MPNRYESELAELANTYAAAVSSEISTLASAIAAASESSIIAVGSGGSYTVASLLCSLHESYTGRVSRPSTPLELISNPTLAASSPVFLISSEGKNPDIIEALRRARTHSARTIHVLTNRAESPLISCAQEIGNVTVHNFELQKKDGYLATNSLLLDCVLVARAYSELDGKPQALPPSLHDLTLNQQTLGDWLQSAHPFLQSVASRQALIVVFSPLIRSVAIDLESKLSEAALMHCQLADIRSFAHGRHLWLAERPDDCAILALIEPSLTSLWSAMNAQLPPNVPMIEMSFSGTQPRDQIAGIIAEMYLIEALSTFAGRDPGKPDVPEFGRAIHYLDLPQFIPRPVTHDDRGETAKFAVLGAQWPSVKRRGYMRRALEQFESELSLQSFKSIVFDYDGTLSGSKSVDSPPPEAILNQLRRLVESGVFVGIASGRGGSIQEILMEHLPDISDRIYLGLYNGGWIAPANVRPVKSEEVSEFLSHVLRIVGRLKTLGVPISDVRPTQPYQVSIRLSSGCKPEEIWLVIADSLRQAGLNFASVVKSKHSVDVLAPGIGKSRLIAHLIEKFAIDPYEILTIGDQGAWPGNDASLLEHRFSLSVDEPSRRLDRGWKLAPSEKRDVDATLWYMDEIKIDHSGQFRIGPFTQGGSE